MNRSAPNAHDTRKVKVHWASRFAPIVARLVVFVVLLGSRASMPGSVATVVRDPDIAVGVARGVDALLWLTAASLLVNLTNALLWRRIVRYALGAPAPSLLRDTSTALIYGGAATAIVTLVFGHSFTAFWTTSGALGLVIGLALRSIILDLFTGVAFSVELSFRIGDWLELVEREAGVPYYGRVVGMSWRTTRLELEDRRVVIVPNSRMGQLIAVNSTMQGGVVRAEVLVSLEFGLPTARACRVLEGAIMALAHTGAVLRDPEPKVLVGAITLRGVEYRVRYWKDVRTTSPSTTRSLVLASVMDHLDAAGITPVVPQQDVHLVRRAEGRADADRLDGRANVLGRVDLFAHALNGAELETLAQTLVRHVVGAGEVLLQEGEEGRSVFVLCEGALSVVRRSDGEIVQLSVIQPGQIVGEMSLLTGAPRSATVKAICESVVYEVKAEALAPLLAERPAIARALSEIATRRSDDAAGATTQVPAPAAVQANLLRKIQRFFAAADDIGVLASDRTGG